MMNWTNQSLIGRIIRLPLRLLPREATMPVLSGPLRSARWTVGASNHGAWLGTYEQTKADIISRAIKVGQVVYDVGAHAGYYALVASRIVGSSGVVVAIEPSPRNLYYLSRHVRMNKAANVRVLGAAVSDTVGITAFNEGPSHFQGMISADGCLIVPTVTLDFLVNCHNLPAPDVMKFDIEGAEYAALLGACDVLRRYHPLIFLATHGPEVHDRCVTLLRSIGYRVTALDGGSPNGVDELLVTYDQ